jgi:hypothetical protein
MSIDIGPPTWCMRAARIILVMTGFPPVPSAEMQQHQTRAVNAVAGIESTTADSLQETTAGAAHITVRH